MSAHAYPHPLHSFQCYAGDQEPEDDPRYIYPIGAVRLGVSPALRRRGESLPTTRCQAAVDDALVQRGLACAGYAQVGLGPEWAESLLYWTDQARSLEYERHQLDVRLRQSEVLVADLEDRGRGLWKRLRLSARLASVAGVAEGAAPRAALVFRDRLGKAQEEAARATIAERLGRNGFGPPQQQELALVVAELPGADGRLYQLRQERLRISAWLAVVRGALIGDVARLCQWAPHVLGAEGAQRVRMGRIFPRRRTAPAALGPTE